MRRRVGVVIGLDLDDRAANPVNQQPGPNQLRRHLMHRTVEELAAYSSAVDHGQHCVWLATL
jgi:hypothetical protein